MPGELRQFILSQIRESGPISFSQFMEWCLYHPEYGYYFSEGVKTGRDGDYYTAPCVHPLFGHLVAKQLFQMSGIMGGKTFEIVEAGGGRGFLCEDILNWAKANAPDFYNRIRYHILEVAPPFVREQRKRLSEYERQGKVFWMDMENLKGGSLRIHGCFLGNELVDAFPVHRVVFQGGSLKEVYVAERNGHFEEICGEPSDPLIAAYFPALGINLVEGQKAEVNLRALEWLERVGQSLEKGFVVTIDYGYPATELYAPCRSHGTIMCYSRHQASENPYERVGEQDITSHVNFTSLIQKGEEVGLKLTGLVPQYRFLIGLGLIQEMESAGEKISSLEGLKMRLSLKHLIAPEGGMGEIFKVLIQHKGIEKPQLDGLRSLSSIPWTEYLILTPEQLQLQNH
ncbi:MAG: SAM-dependent methyltransferase [Syntrophales bacterium]|nr:SAM-dependent methyltransferase [Syntrophales bacterium]